MLEFDGYIQKIKGKNSRVLEYGRFKNSLSNLQTSQELNKIEKIDIKTNAIFLIFDVLTDWFCWFIINPF